MAGLLVRRALRGEGEFFLSDGIEQGNDGAFGGGAAVDELDLVARLEPCERLLQPVKVAVQDATVMFDDVRTELDDGAGEVAAGAGLVQGRNLQDNRGAGTARHVDNGSISVGGKELEEEL